MDVLQRLWPSLAESQRKLIEDMALALAGIEPRREPERLSVAQISQRFGKSTSAVYKAMDEGRLPYVTPHGQSKPRYATAQDVTERLGWTPSSGRTS